MLFYTTVSIIFMTVACSYQNPVKDSETSHGWLEISEVPDTRVSTKPNTLLVQTFPRYVISYQESPNEVVTRRIRRSSRDLPATSRQGRFLLKYGLKQLQNAILWSSLLANTVGTGTISATNSFNLFGKTINSALSIAYGDRFFLPPAIPPPVPIAPPVLPVRPILPVVPPVLPVVNPVLPIVPQPPFPIVPQPPFPIVPFIPPVTTTANEVNPILTPITASVGATIPPTAGSVKKGDTSSTKRGGQTDETKREQSLEQYMEMEMKNQKLMREYNEIIKEQQKIATNQNEQWKEFLKQHNLMVDKFNDVTYIKMPRVNEVQSRIY